MRIEDVLARRSDLSTFLVHLTRTTDGLSGGERLRRIIQDRKLRAKTPMGHAVQALDRARLSASSQLCVSFTETPLEHVALLVEDIEGRACRFEPYGVAITRKQGRKAGVNPVWYVDITPGHGWLSNSINDLVDAATAAAKFDGSPIANLTPFVEQMGTGQPFGGQGYRKEFWWEREWRYVGDLPLPGTVIILCPEDEVPNFKEVVDSLDTALHVRYVDPRWSLEQIVARLAGFAADDVGPF